MIRSNSTDTDAADLHLGLLPEQHDSTAATTSAKPPPVGAKRASTLNSNFLAALSADERAQVFARAAQTIQALKPWVARYPLTRQVRVWPVCLSFSAAAPFCSVSSLVSIVSTCLWIFMIDDLIDEELLPADELRCRLDCYQQLLRSGTAAPPEADDPLLAALHDIRAELAGYPLFPHLEDLWAQALSDTISSMRAEDAWRASYRAALTTPVLPTYDAYLKQSVRSIGTLPCMWTALIGINDRSTVAQLAPIQQLMYESSLCVRLANDLQTHARDLHEGNVNAILIHQHQLIASGIAADSALAQARATVQAAIHQALARCTELRSCDSTASGQPERAIVDLARFLCDFYSYQDFHTASAQPEEAPQG